MPLKKLCASALVALLLVLLVPASSYAQPPMRRDPSPAAHSPADEMKKEAGPAPEETVAVTQHRVKIGQQTIEYTATAGTMLLKEEQGKAKASIFYTAYTKNGVSKVGDRPVTFVFNGGPGSSSVWLHLGVFGPRRVKMDPEGKPLPPPYELVDNEYSLLDETDLVMIDPVTTGFSRAAPGEDPSQFHGLYGDVEAVGEFVRLWTTRNGRWTSPKFIAGESYGTTRAAGLVGWLQQRHGMYFNGVILVSSILQFATARFDTGNDLPYPLFLPTYTATAWYHGQLEGALADDLQFALNEAETFALGEYASALMMGDLLPDERRQLVAKRLAELTGLSVDYIERANLRPSIHRFVRELRRDEGLTVGRLDSRFSAPEPDGNSERMRSDPSYTAIQGPYTATFNDYVRNELEFKSDLPYEILSGRVRPWSYAEFENRYVNVAEFLRDAMLQNRDLKVHVANGYYDLATPYFATEYTFHHLGLPESLRDNVSMSYYESGHMMYIQIASLKTFYDEIGGFIRDAVGE